MPKSDQVGMGIAVNMLFELLRAKPHMKGQTVIQFDLMHQPRATFTAVGESSQAGIKKGSTYALGSMKVTVTTCPMQQKWFNLFLRGAKCEKFLSGSLCVVTTLFSQQDGISIFKLSKRFLEVSCRDLTSLLTLF